ncbi:MAG TPA: DNA (cytosine-5-)-methyltransferase [Solirubrobacterales bacterium]|nr:DNA (cytosine-5-)-methyltransferase [Solirubrobacterales bacterium]
MTSTSTPLNIVGLFAGIGGFELGFSRAGHVTTLLVDDSPAAQAVLKAHFPEADVAEDVRDLKRLPPNTDVVCAGFPCQDLSSVGRKEGIRGDRSSLVGEVFRLVEGNPVPWLVLENVPFILQLGGGGAMKLITSALEELGYRWAYRVIDTQAFGLPQRRRRWYLVASNVHDPRAVLLHGDATAPQPSDERSACGFYWTEGTRALGWAVDAVPPVKGGSSIGVPSPPAILTPSGDVVTPDIRDAERLQGFEADWTRPLEEVAKPGFRWQAVGNAVSVDVVEWIAMRISSPEAFSAPGGCLPIEGKWPYAAWMGGDGLVYAAEVGHFPQWKERPPLIDFLQHPTKPLSARAAAGFLKRAKKGNLRFEAGFLEAVQSHLDRQLSPQRMAA